MKSYLKAVAFSCLRCAPDLIIQLAHKQCLSGDGANAGRCKLLFLQQRLLGKWNLCDIVVVAVDIVLSPQAPSKDAVRDVCVQSHQGPSRRLAESTAATLSIPAAQAAQV